MKKHLEHITIKTGHTRHSPLSEVNSFVIKHICDAFAKGGGICPELDEFRVDMIEAQRGTWVYDIFCNGERMVACWLCADPTQSDFLWSYASRAGTFEGAHLHDPVRTPWLAVALCPTPRAVEKFLGAMSIVGDLERCIAWALMTAARPAGSSSASRPDSKHSRAGKRP